MSLARTALRLATIMALVDKGDGSGAAATLAGRRVYDSMMEPEHLFGTDKPTPLIIVYTDDDDGPNRNAAGGPPTFDRACDLTLELVCATTRDEGGSAQVVMPQTDAELEAVLDLLEFQARAALTSPASRWAGLWGRLSRGMLDYSSTRVMDENGSVRMAARTLRSRVRVPDDCPPEPVTSLPADSGIAALPAPLRAIAEAVDDATKGDAKSVKDLIAYLMAMEIPVTALLPVLETVGLEAHAGDVPEGKVGVVDAPIENLGA